MNWPLVHELDDGIRPAGKPNECFYCNKKVGAPHADDCVVVTKRVLMRITTPDGSVSGNWILDVPHSFSPDSIEFRYNEGTWCANNIFDYDVSWDQPNALARLRELDIGCLCDVLEFKFVRVVDDTPRRKLQDSCRLS